MQLSPVTVMGVLIKASALQELGTPYTYEVFKGHMWSALATDSAVYSPETKGRIIKLLDSHTEESRKLRMQIAAIAAETFTLVDGYQVVQLGPIVV
jgi:hypothetical protein